MAVLAAAVGTIGLAGVSDGTGLVVRTAGLVVAFVDDATADPDDHSADSDEHPADPADLLISLIRAEFAV
ncbi:MAG: hypothetical protein H7269_06170 [Cellulomonas sp.]|nr:hypothetical protein [Cellulomonas sp.]